MTEEGSSRHSSAPIRESSPAAGECGRLSGELLASREAREQVLSQLTAVAAPEEGTLPLATPAVLLPGVEWSVMDPPSAAVVNVVGSWWVQQQAQQQRQQLLADDPDVIPDSEEEEEGVGVGFDPLCLSATQAVVGEMLAEHGGCGGGRGDSSQGSTEQQALPAWVDEVVLRGSSLTVLLPQDGRGELGHASLTWQLPVRQITAGELLRRVHAWYQDALPPEEVLALLKAHPGARAAAALLRPAFLELQAVQRGALLGPRVGWEGLVKATREPCGTVYELRLGC